MANVIIHSAERTEDMRKQLHDYGIDPRTASSTQRDMADCIAQKSAEALRESDGARKYF